MKKLWIVVVLAGCSQAPPPAMEMKQDTKKVLAIEIVSKYRANFIPWENPLETAWKEATPTTLKLIPQQVQEPMLMTPSIGELRVRSIHSDAWIAFQLEWDDASCSNTLRSDRFGDACAVEFPLKNDPLPDYRMGDEGRPVQLMLWRAERQRALEEKISFFDENYPNAWTDTYPFEPKVGEHANDPALQTERKRYVGSQAAENPFRIGIAPMVEELSAQTWNKLTGQKSQDACGRGIWREGHWTVVVVRPLTTSDPEDATLSGIKEWPVAFAAWDGGQQNAGPRKMVVEGWIKLRIER
jgi:hypothetical protein